MGKFSEEIDYLEYFNNPEDIPERKLIKKEI
jgi:hypothetical protein